MGGGGGVDLCSHMFALRRPVVQLVLAVNEEKRNDNGNLSVRSGRHRQMHNRERREESVRLKESRHGVKREIDDLKRNAPRTVQALN